MSFAFVAQQVPPGQGIVSGFPKSWRVDVLVFRSGGRDAKGNPKPAEEIQVPDCIIGDRSTAEQLGFTDVADSEAVLLRDPGFTFLSTDRIRVPSTGLMPGDWAVVGRPFAYPLGTVVGLRGA